MNSMDLLKEVFFPFGGSVGHKGYALGLLVEILGVATGVSTTSTDAFGNGVCFLVINTNSFTQTATFKALMSESSNYMKSSSPAEGFEEVLVPGELEFRYKRQREKEGIRRPCNVAGNPGICQQVKP